MEFLSIVDRNTTDHVNVEGIVRDLGIGLDPAASLPEGHHGRMAPTSDGTWKIELNSIDNDLRKRFTTAHLIGHWIMHRALLGSGLHEGGEYAQDPLDEFHNDNIGEHEESEANVFASELLLPAGLVLPLADKESLDYSTAARILKCSVSGLKIRMDLLEHGPREVGIESLIPEEIGV